MKLRINLTNEEIYHIDNTIAETSNILASIDMGEPVSKLIDDGDVIDTGSIKIKRVNNQIDIDVDSKFVFWCLRFATRISKFTKTFYSTFSGLFEEIANGNYFKKEVVRYNIHDNIHTDAATRIQKNHVLDAFRLMSINLERHKRLKRSFHETRSYILHHLDVIEHDSTFINAKWKEANIFISSIRYMLIVEVDTTTISRVKDHIEAFISNNE